MNSLSLIAIMSFLPISAQAQVRDAGSLLRGSILGLGQVGFEGMQGIPMPQPPSYAAAAPILTTVDETAQAVATLEDAARPTSGGAPGDTLRKLGIAFDGESSPSKGLGATDSESKRLFGVVIVQGKKYVLIEEMKKAVVPKQLQSYLIGADGGLLAAAVTRKENGKFIAEPISLADAAAGHREQLDFWVRYYRANLKKP